MARKTKGESEALRNRAYELYMSCNMTYADIAHAIGVGKDTISEWAGRFKWKESKAANSITREKNVSMLLVQINNQLTEINERKGKKFPTAQEQASIMWASKTIELLSNKTSLPDYFNVQSEFIKYLHTVNPALAKQVVDYNKEFLQVKTRELA